MQPTSRLPHLVRGSIAAGIATFAALFSHVIGGGAMPGPIGIAVPLLLSLTVSILLAGRSLSLPRLSASVVISQTLFHTLFVLGTPAAGSAPAASAMSGHHHGHATTAMLPGMLPARTFSDQTVALVQGDPLMWVSHALGAVITIAFLYRGERAVLRLWALADQVVAWVRHRFTAPLPLPNLTPPARVQTIATVGWAVLTQIHASTLSRRGPPPPIRIARQPASA